MVGSEFDWRLSFFHSPTHLALSLPLLQPLLQTLLNFSNLIILTFCDHFYIRRLTMLEVEGHTDLDRTFYDFSAKNGFQSSRYGSKIKLEAGLSCWTSFELVGTCRKLLEWIKNFRVLSCSVVFASKGIDSLQTGQRKGFKTVKIFRNKCQFLILNLLELILKDFMVDFKVCSI